MKFIADVHISPKTVKDLQLKGYQIERITSFLPPTAKDEEILSFAIRKGFCIITQDLDFSALLAKRRIKKPSVITLRLEKVNPQEITYLLQEILPRFEPQITSGSIIIVEADRVRIRKLPLEV